MKISVIFTGGTIGSVRRDDGYIGPESTPVSGLSSFFDNLTHHSFTFYEPLTTLSECITARKLNIIIDTLRTAADSADGVIITHGTDSLAYSAAALGYALFDIKIPVVMVCSSHVLEDKRANGLKNLADALTFIESSNAKGVFVSYNGKIHRGTRLCPPKSYTDRVESVLDSEVGSVENGIFVPYAEAFIADEFSPYRNLCEGRKILILPAVPDFNYDGISRDCYAAIQLSYHSGTVDATNPSLRRFAKDLRDLGRPLLLHGSYRGAEYLSKSEYEKIGIVSLPVISAAAVYMKLMITDFENVSKPLGGDILQEENLVI